MLTKIQEKLIEILRADLNGTDEADLSHLTNEELDQIYDLSRKHNVFTMVGDYMYRHGIEHNQILRSLINAQKIVQRQDKAISDVTKVLNDVNIDFLVLKGVQMRKLYPQPWMRLSGDIDIFIHENDNPVFNKVLTETLSYTHTKYPIEDHYTTPEGIELDVSSKLYAPIAIDINETIYSDIWNYSVPETEDSCLHILTDDMRYTHAVIHMARHLRNGGCGINHIMDLWVLNHCLPTDKESLKKRNDLLKEKHIEKAETELRKLSEKWFSKASIEVTPGLEEFILDGFAHGTEESKHIAKVKGTRRLSYQLSRIFVPYSHLVILFPNLEGKRWLTPIYEVLRWIRQIKKGRTAAIIDEFSQIDAKKSNSVRHTTRMLKILGI